MSELISVQPHNIIELNDVITGGRKLGIVDDTGLGYYDLHGDGELPKPLHASLRPVDLGTIPQWYASMDGDAEVHFIAAWEALTERHGQDVLFIARALRWGMEHRNYSVPDLERMGKAATDSIIASRNRVSAGLAANS